MNPIFVPALVRVFPDFLDKWDIVMTDLKEPLLDFPSPEALTLVALEIWSRSYLVLRLTAVLLVVILFPFFYLTSSLNLYLSSFLILMGLIYT